MANRETTPWRTLLGFFKADEALGFAKSQGYEFSPDEEAALKREIEKALRAVAGLPDRTGTSPEMLEVPVAASEHLSKIEKDPTFAEHTNGMLRWGWKLVEIAKLRTFQTQVNQSYVDRLAEEVPPVGDFLGALRFCVPERGSKGLQKVTMAFNPVTNTFSVVSENLDLRILGQAQGEDPTTKRKFTGFAWGFGLPTISVVGYKGKYMIRNGYHRAFALLKKGHTHLPALVLETDNFQLTGAAAAGFFSIDVLLSSRPPLMADFLTDAAIIIPRPKMRTVLLIHAEVQALAV